MKKQQAKEHWLRFIPDDPGGLIREQFLAKAEEVYSLPIDGILYEKMEEIGDYQGGYDQIIQSWVAPNGSNLWESRSADDKSVEMEGMTLSVVDERGATYDYIENFAGGIPTEGPYCIFIDEDQSSIMKMELNGSQTPPYGEYSENKGSMVEDMSPIDEFFATFYETHSSFDSAKVLLESLKNNSDWAFSKREEEGKKLYVFTTVANETTLEVVFDMNTFKLSEFTTVETDGETISLHFIEQTILPLEEYDAIFNPEAYPKLSLVDISPVPLPGKIESGCYSFEGERLSKKEEEALLSTLKDGYIEDAWEMVRMP